MPEDDTGKAGVGGRAEIEENPAVGDVHSGRGQGAGDAQRAVIDGGAAGVGVGPGENQGAVTALGEGGIAADVAGNGQGGVGIGADGAVGGQDHRVGQIDGRSVLQCAAGQGHGAAAQGAIGGDG